MARPPVPLLSRESIVSAAMKLASKSGDFTMAALSRSLGVRPSSLYNHVTSKREVINLIRSVWLGELLDEARAIPRGLHRLVFMAEGLYERVVQSPGLIPLLFVEPLIEHESLAFYDEIAASARAAGAAESELSAIVALVDAYVFGSALDASSPPIELTPELAERYPHVGVVVESAVTHSRRGARDFRTGLSIISAGIRERTAQHSTPDNEEGASRR